jgi:hypothetical protein
MTEDDLTRYHEAGHAVIMIAEGFVFTEVSVEPTPHRLGAVTGGEQRLETQDQAEAWIVCALAGEIAEGYALSQSPNAGDRDFGLEDVLPYLKTWATAPIHHYSEWGEIDDDPEGDPGDWEPDYPERDIPKAQRVLNRLEPTLAGQHARGEKLFDCTLELVKAYWETIETVATMLATQPTVSYPAILETFNFHRSETAR